MTDNEIIKALERCVKDGYPYGCEGCPYRAEDCNERLDADALDLINRQKAEIERLKKENHHFADIGKMYSEVKAEAIKEFAERLKERYSSVWTHDGHEEAVLVLHKSLDNLVKEMVGEE